MHLLAAVLILAATAQKPAVVLVHDAWAKTTEIKCSNHVPFRSHRTEVARVIEAASQ